MPEILCLTWPSKQNMKQMFRTIIRVHLKKLPLVTMGIRSLQVNSIRELIDTLLRLVFMVIKPPFVGGNKLLLNSIFNDALR